MISGVTDLAKYDGYLYVVMSVLARLYYALTQKK